MGALQGVGGGLSSHAGPRLSTLWWGTGRRDVRRGGRPQVCPPSCTPDVALGCIQGTGAGFVPSWL